MEETKGFYDFCIPYRTDHISLITLLTEAYNMDYRTVAIEQIFDHSKKEATKRSGDVFPAPVDLEFLSDFKNKLKILHRLTVIYSDVAVSHAMTNSLNIKKYHLIAGLPTSDAALTHCCTTFNGDIVCFDPENPKLLVSRKAYQLAVKRGMCFEIKYAMAIVNSSYRKDMIKIAHNYHAKGKSRNIIFSSGASNAFELRGPYDIANLALIFGLSEEQGRNSMSNTCRILFRKAESRRIGKTIMFVKQFGPTILSSSDESGSGSDEDHEGEDDAMERDKSDEDNTEQQPHKKKRLC